MYRRSSKAGVIRAYVIAAVLIGAWIAIIVRPANSPATPAATPLDPNAPLAPMMTPQGPQAFPEGVPAIKPHLAYTGSPDSATFDTIDVRNWVTQNGIPGVQASGSVMITRILFTTSSQVSQLLGGEQTGLPATSSVCYVELQGTFQVAQGPGYVGTPTIVTFGYLVFDSETGNLLMSSH